MVSHPHLHSKQGPCSTSAQCCCMQWEEASQLQLLLMEDTILLFLQLPSCDLLQLWGFSKKTQQVLSAPMGPNYSEQPQLGPPPTPSAQQLYLSSALGYLAGVLGLCFCCLHGPFGYVL